MALRIFSDDFLATGLFLGTRWVEGSSESAPHWIALFPGVLVVGIGLLALRERTRNRRQVWPGDQFQLQFHHLWLALPSPFPLELLIGSPPRNTVKNHTKLKAVLWLTRVATYDQLVLSILSTFGRTLGMPPMMASLPLCSSPTWQETGSQGRS